MSWVALRPEEQNRFTLEAAVVLGKPAAREAARTRYAALPSLTYCVSEIVRRADGREAYIATADVLDKLRVDFRFLDDFLEERIYEVIELSILKSTFEALCQWCADCESDNYIVGILRGAVDVGISNCFVDF